MSEQKESQTIIHNKKLIEQKRERTPEEKKKYQEVMELVKKNYPKVYSNSKESKKNN